MDTANSEQSDTASQSPVPPLQTSTFGKRTAPEAFEQDHSVIPPHILKKARTDSLDDHCSHIRRSPPWAGIDNSQSEEHSERAQRQLTVGPDNQYELHQERVDPRVDLTSPVLSDEEPVAAREARMSRCMPPKVKLEDSYPGTKASPSQHRRFSPGKFHVYRITPDAQIRTHLRRGQYPSLDNYADTIQDAQHYAALGTRLRRGQYRPSDNHTETSQGAIQAPQRPLTRQVREPKEFFALDYQGKPYGI